MGGETTDRLDETDEIEELGSVGDWGIPSWMPRLPRLAWLFIALTVADVVVQLVLRVGMFDGPGRPDLREAFGVVTQALPILVPGAIVVRAGRDRLTPRDPLFAGAIAIAVSILLGTAAMIVREQFYVPVAAEPDDLAQVVVAAILSVLGTILGFAGPILLARAVLSSRRGPAPRWATWASVAVFVLAGVQVVYSLASAYVSLAVFPSSFDDFGPGLIVGWVLGVAGSFTVFTWAYLGWAIFSVAADQTPPTFAWAAGVGSTVARQVAAGLFLVVTTMSDDNVLGLRTTSEAIFPLTSAFFTVASVLHGVSSILFTVAFSTGLGGPISAGSDAPSIELEPLPNPG